MSKERIKGFLKDLDFIDNRAFFSRIHVIKTLLLLHKKPLGRTKLMKKLNLSEASVRTLLKKLNEENIAKPSSKGHILTEKGEIMVEKLEQKTSGPIRLNSTELTVGEVGAAVLVRNVSFKVGGGIKQRDAAIKVGAEGATTIKYEKDKFQINEEEIDIPKKIKSSFKPKNGDVIIIGSASDYIKAEEGALAATLSLV